ncbi:sensor histidine kinase [Candidatus Enterococcus ferrettii]|uniref:histidine kinase n=1 Tax=Candidatus Enterococcus ferrettii TaxID=2815324 RepID=A0ABV0ENM2_9ENTE|nr:sensor histidine kinase [Enterococcus sp. 665A]MBO1343082.1 sensor histidine kinase [Enterococcus sp. 665A]
MTKYTYWLEYLFLFISGALLLFSSGFQPENIWYVLIAILLIAPAPLFPNKIGAWLSFAAIVITGMLVPSFLFFFPATLRIIWRKQKPYDWLMPCGILALLLQPEITIFVRGLLASLSLFALYLCLREREYIQLRSELLQLKDDSWEKQELLKEQNDELIRSQETFVELEIAEERNRIARDIHDNVGHLLSSAIIQLGAVEALNQDSTVGKLLEQLKETIHSGMNSIRKSVHDLHNDSLNLTKSVPLLLADFRFCPVELEGTIPETLSKTQEKVLLTVIKEALSNVMKHSQATQVRLVFDELPAFYRLKILDNGKSVPENPEITNGMGLASMRQRVQKINGQLHIHPSQKGFQINIILPKETNDDTGSSSG